MNDERDEQLARLLTDTADAVDPGERLDAIRARTGEARHRTRRSWLVAGGAGLATAATVAAIALATGSLSNPAAGPDPDPAGSGTPTQAADPDEPTTSAATSAVPVYLVGDTADGPRLYREFLPVPSADVAEEAEAAVRRSVTGDGADPDYRSLWPAGVDVDHVEVTDDQITVSLIGAPHDLPAGLTEADAALALEQVVYTAQGVVQQGRLPVLLLADDQPTDAVLGRPASEPLANGDLADVLARVSLTAPAEGEVATGDALTVEGVANAFEATVLWSLADPATGEVVDEGYFTAAGWMDKLYPFAGEVDLAGLPPGTYLLTVSESDPSGGAEGTAGHTDTRTFVIE